MKKNNLTNSLFAVLLLSSPLAGADSKYPAADFQPEVLYQDDDYIAKNSQAVKASSSSKETISSAPESSETDAKYPAANFQPQVVYSDDSYKHSENLTAGASVEKQSVAIVSSEENKVEGVVADKKEESSPIYLFGIIGLAIAGFFLFKKQSGVCTKRSEKAAAVYKSASPAITGVARYLNKTSGTGVSRYLEKQVKSTSSVTGVARYVAKQVLSAKTTTAKAATGVEKYVRDRG